MMYSIHVNGIDICYRQMGEGDPLVMVHGNGEDHGIFSVETEQLAAAGYRVYAPDSRGHGANDPLPEYHYADMAERANRQNQTCTIQNRWQAPV